MKRDDHYVALQRAHARRDLTRDPGWAARGGTCQRWARGPRVLLSDLQPGEWFTTIDGKAFELVRQPTTTAGLPVVRDAQGAETALIAHAAVLPSGGSPC